MVAWDTWAPTRPCGATTAVGSTFRLPTGTASSNADSTRRIGILFVVPSATQAPVRESPTERARAHTRGA